MKTEFSVKHLTAEAEIVIFGLGEPSANDVIAGVVDLIPLGRKVLRFDRWLSVSVEAQVNASAQGLFLFQRSAVF